LFFDQVYDMTDDRPWSLLHSERATATTP
jgi:hypothetical protein